MLRVDSVSTIDDYNIVVFNNCMAKVYYMNYCLTPAPIFYQCAHSLFTSRHSVHITNSQILVYSRSVIVSYLAQPLNLYEDVVFSSYALNADETCLAFVMESPKKREPHQYTNTLGECFANKSNPIIGVYDIQKSVLKLIEYELLLPQKPIFTPNNEILISAFPYKDHDLINGIFYCLNRESHLYICTNELPTQITHDYISQGHRFINNKQIAYFGCDYALVHAIMDIRIITYPEYNRISTIECANGIYGGYFYLNQHCFISVDKLYFNVHQHTTIQSMVADLKTDQIMSFLEGCQILCGNPNGACVYASNHISHGYTAYLKYQSKIIELFSNPPPFPIQVIHSTIKGIETITLSKQGTKNDIFVIYLHGGPHSSFVTTQNKEIHEFLANEYSVIAINYPGSIGYGKKFMEQSTGHMNERDYSSIIEIVEAIVPRQAKGVFLYGGSHGGYLAIKCASNWSLHVPIKGCILRNPSLDMNIMASLSDIPDWPIEEGLGEAYNDRINKEQIKRLYSISATNSVGNLSCPVLILVGNKDKRVPMEIGAYLWRILKLENKNCEMVELNSDHSLMSAEEAVRSKAKAFMALHSIVI